MNNLTDFLFACIAEDELQIRTDLGCDCHVAGLPPQHGVRCGVKLLAECEARRELIARALKAQDALRASDYGLDRDSAWRRGLFDGFDHTLRVLAAPYREHAGFRDEWKTS